MSTLIFANGVLNESPRVLAAVQAASFIIAADGGAIHCQRLGVIPQLVLGDLDSLSAEDTAKLIAQGVEFIRHPARKDYTDLELALQYASEKGAEEVLVLGALGKRWDQTLANLMLPAAQAYSNIVIRLIDGQQELNLVRSGQKLELNGRPGDIVSLIPLGGDASGVTTDGLEYPLSDATLIFGSTRGISNVLLDRRAMVSLDQGLMVAVLIHLD